MHHVAQARRHNAAKLIVIDPYRTKTADKADLHLMLKPGTDGALACAVMHVLFEEDMADHQYMEKYTDKPEEFRQHLSTKTPEWAANITGLSVDSIRSFARMYGQSKNSFLRIGYGLTRSRNGAVNMHAVSCLPAVTGAWQYEGGGALHSNADIYQLDRGRIQGADIECQTRIIDQSSMRYWAMPMIYKVVHLSKQCLFKTQTQRSLLPIPEESWMVLPGKIYSRWCMNNL